MKISLILWLGLLSFAGAESPDPKQPPLDHLQQVLIKQEAFRVPKQAAQALLLAGKTDSALHAKLREMVAAKTAHLLNVILVRVGAGQRPKVEQVNEFPYATDFDPEQLPQNLTLINPRALGLPAAPGIAPFVGPLRLPQPVSPSNAGFGIMGSITPTTFEIRNLGETLEVDFHGVNDQRIWLNIATESVQLAGLFEQNSEEMSQIETQKLNTVVKIASGAPCFVGTLSKSCQTGTASANQNDDLTLAFITATLDAPPSGDVFAGPDETVRYQWELISLPKSAAANLLEETSDSAALHAKLLTMIKAKTATLEGLQSLRAKFGQRERVEAVDEFSYPMNFDPPQLIQALTVADQWLMDIFHQEGGRVAAAPDKPLHPANGGFGIMSRVFASAFDSRKVGDVLEIEPFWEADGVSVRVNLAAERVRFLAMRTQEDCKQPIFETQRLKTSFRLGLNRPQLVGTMSPPAHTGVDGGNREERVWLAFLTATTTMGPVDEDFLAAYGSRTLLVRDEWFTLPKEEFRLLMGSGLSDPELRKDLVKRVAAKTATLDRFMLIRTRSGQRAKVEHIDEFPYPTDFDPGEVTPVLTIVDQKALGEAMKQPLAPPATFGPLPVKRAGKPINGGIGLQNTVTGTTFEVRNIGDMLEVDPVLDEDRKTIGLNVAAEKVTFVGYAEYGDVIKPQFQTSKFNNAYRAISGVPILASTCSKADRTGREGGNTEDKVTVSFITATATAPPLPETKVPPKGESSMRFQWELISLPTADASALFDETLDDAALHRRLVTMIGANTAKLEKLLSLRTMSGQRAKIEQIAETPFPTDFDPPQIPQHLTIADPQLVEILRQGGAPSQEAAHRPPLGPPNSGFGLITGLSPTTWETRNVGESMEIDPVLGEDGVTVDMNVAPESSRLVGEVKFEEAIQPVFETQKLNTAVTSYIGQPCLLGTMSRPYRTGAPGGNQEDRVWLAFITARLD